LPKRLVKIKNTKYILKNAYLKKLEHPINQNNYLLEVEKFKYLLNIYQKNSKNYLQLTRTETIGTQISNAFQVLTGGTIFYNFKTLRPIQKENGTVSYYNRSNRNKLYNCIVRHRTLIWLSEEFHEVNCEPNILLVEAGDFISKGFELIPGLFSKTSGLVTIVQKNNVIKTIVIKSGLVYEGN